MAPVSLRFVPDCVVLVRRLLGDPRVPRRNRLALGALLLYLLSPIDLICPSSGSSTTRC